jgi:hypothetical protein
MNQYQGAPGHVRFVGDRRSPKQKGQTWLV